MGHRVLTFAIALLAPVAQAADVSEEERSFGALWQRIEDRSPALRQARQERDAASRAWQRSKRHWLPRISFDGRVYATNDPATSFFALLNQRVLFPADLTPERLTHPGTGVYEQFALRAEWLAYEGGGPSAQARVDEQLVQAKELEGATAAIEQYTEAGSLYGALILHREALEEWRSLSASTDELLAAYQIRTPENPRGYAGLLALKALKNRIAISRAQEEEAFSAARDALSTLAGLAGSWRPTDETFEEFARINLPATEGPAGTSARVQQLQAAARAAAQTVDVERARFLPQIGFFLDVPVSVGNRAAAVSFTTGAYLRWEVFSPATLDGIQQARMESSAASSRAEAEAEREDIEAARARRTSGVLSQALPLLADNARLLDEQTQITNQLFVNGAVNALQLSESLSRRADLVEVRTETRLRYLEAVVTLARRSASRVPDGAHGR